MEATITAILNAAPMFAGLVLCIWIQKRTIDRQYVEHDAMEKRYDGLMSKVIEISLTCHDEQAKARLSEFVSQQAGS